MSDEYSDDGPGIVLRRCRPWLERNGPPPVESDTRNFSKRRRKGRKFGDRAPPNFTPSTMVPFGRVVTFGVIAWEIYRRISAWVNRDSTRSNSNNQLIPSGSDQQQLTHRRAADSSLQPLAEPDPRTGMILQQLSHKTGYPSWASNPMQPERLDRAVKQQYRDPERVRRSRRMVMQPTGGVAPPLEWMEQQKEEDERNARRNELRPPPRKAVIPHRRITLLERAAREAGTRFDVDGDAAGSAAERRQRIQQRRRQLQQEMGAGQGLGEAAASM